MAGDRALERLKALRPVALELRHHEHHDVRRHLGQRHVGPVTADQAGLLQPSQPLPAGRGRQVHPAGKVDLGDPPLAAEDGQDLQVAVVEGNAAHPLRLIGEETLSI